ncbi:PREDICTED: translation initiation factor IF-2-like, partial [Chinchilla lanigera]|uniref:translation initiation factor IF-2-like n=1 Tax=Chinchilla lanigera TaxID=34839 RepID=UPI0006984F83
MYLHGCTRPSVNTASRVCPHLSLHTFPPPKLRSPFLTDDTWPINARQLRKPQALPFPSLRLPRPTGPPRSRPVRGSALAAAPLRWTLSLPLREAPGAFRGRLLCGKPEGCALCRERLPRPQPWERSCALPLGSVSRPAARPSAGGPALPSSAEPLSALAAPRASSRGLRLRTAAPSPAGPRPLPALRGS